jgi:hypothetical protein
MMALQKYFVRAAAWLEIGAGIALIASPNLGCQLLFATQLDDPGVLFTRFAGIALLALGAACMPTPETPQTRAAVLGLFLYNAGVTMLFVWVGVATALHGILFWPAVLLHAGIAVALLALWLNRGSIAS